MDMQGARRIRNGSSSISRSAAGFTTRPFSNSSPSLLVGCRTDLRKNFGCRAC